MNVVEKQGDEKMKLAQERTAGAGLVVVAVFVWLAVVVFTRDLDLIVGVGFVAMGVSGAAYTAMVWANRRIADRPAAASFAMFVALIALGGVRFAPIWFALPATLALLPCLIVALAVLYREGKTPEKLMERSG